MEDFRSGEKRLVIQGELDDEQMMRLYDLAHSFGARIVGYCQERAGIDLNQETIIEEYSASEPDAKQEIDENQMLIHQREFRIWSREHNYSEHGTASIWSRLVETSFAVHHLGKKFPSNKDAPKFPTMQHYEYRKDTRSIDRLDVDGSYGLDLLGLVDYLKWSLNKIDEASQISEKTVRQRMARLLPPGIGPGKLLQLVGFIDDQLGQVDKISDLLPKSLTHSENEKLALPDAYQPEPTSAFLTHGRITRDGLVIYAMDQAHKNGEINPKHSVEHSWLYIVSEFPDLFGLDENYGRVYGNIGQASTPAVELFKRLKEQELTGTQSGLSPKAYNRLVGLLRATNIAE